MKKLIHTILNFLFPQKCAGCGKSDEILCGYCLKKIAVCGYIDKNMFAAGFYSNPILKKSIKLLKYKNMKLLAKPLASLIYSRLANKNTFKNWIIVPVPLSAKRFRQRGFNQSELIAKHLSDKLSIKLETNVLYKKIHTESQTKTKKREERLKNLKDSFEIKNSELAKNKNIILIDDVCTTGATISEAKRALRRARPKKILTIVIAKSGQ